ncbi:MAG: HEAT repeat domain-containing protein [Candidatus Ornithomonoglobus sp.]
MNDIQSTIELIGKAENAEDIDISYIMQTTKGCDTIDKCDIISALSRFAAIQEIQQLAISMADDEDELVQCEAYELLEQSKNYDVLPLLAQKLNAEKKSLVKLYIFMAIYWIIVDSKICDNNIFIDMYKRYETEKSIRGRIGYCMVLYLWKHESKYIDILTNYISHKDYHIRCTAINSLNDLYISSLDNVYKQKVTDCLENRLKSEKSRAVISSINSVLKNVMLI